MRTIQQSNQHPGHKMALMDFQSTLGLKQALTAYKISEVKATEPMNEIIKTLNTLIKFTCNKLNTGKTMDDAQIVDLSMLLANEYSFLTIPQLLYIFKKGERGLFGPLFNKVDKETICTWIDKHLSSDEYTLHLEAEATKFKKATPLIPEPLVKIWKEVVESLPKVEPVAPNVFPKKPQSEESFIENLKEEIQEFENEDLEQFLKQFNQKGWIAGIDLITNEINRRKDPEILKAEQEAKEQERLESKKVIESYNSRK